MNAILITKFFRDQKLNVSYNTLGINEEMKKAFVAETQKYVESNGNASQNVKNELYNMFYEFSVRPKYTGFEKFSQQDVNYRVEINNEINAPQFSEGHVHAKDYVPRKSYKNLLLDHVKTLDNCLLYLSGGLDSEFVANAMLEAGIHFKPVIFRWTDSAANIKNDFDTCYAFDFCEKHGLTPIVKTVDIEFLWKTENFKNLSKQIEMISPQITTYAYMVKIMEEEFPNAKHVFGGEVRFLTNYNDEDEIKNLIFQEKVTPGYTGGWYALSDVGGGTSPAMSIFLRYSNVGTWNIGWSGQTLVQVPTSGTWTTTPASAYEFRISNIDMYYGDVAPGDITPSPGSVPTGWSPINSTTTEICRVDLAPTSIFFNVGATFTIQVRSIAWPATVLTSSIEMSISKEI